jgi:phage baseplate assembly protein W
MVNLTNILGTDLKLNEFIKDKLGPDLSLDGSDLGVISGEMNLAQAILHRLRTIKGELADLGHPDYGSNIYELVGEPNNEYTRERLRIIINETLKQERRVKEIISIIVRIPSNHRTYNIDNTKGIIKLAEIGTEDIDNLKANRLESVEVNITIIPIESNVPLNIVFPFYLEVV